MIPIESNEFWGDAHRYAFTTGEEQFVSVIITEMIPIESNEFWGDAHRYAFTTGEEQFVSEIAYIMTTLHEEGYDN